MGIIGNRLMSFYFYLKGGEILKYSLDKYIKQSYEDEDGVVSFRLSKEDIADYLTSTYTPEELDHTRISEPTFLDVIGYTCDEDGFETVEGAYYELEEIEEMMYGFNLNDIEGMDDEDEY